MTDKTKKTWLRKEDESVEAHEAALVYFRLGPNRSIPIAAQLCGKSESLLEKWSAKHKWKTRSREYDSHIAEVEQAGIDDQVRKTAALAQKREQAFTDAQLNMAEELMQRAKEMLAAPLFRKKTTKEERDDRGNLVAAHYTIEPVRFTASTPSALARTAADLFERATENNRTFARDEFLSGDIGVWIDMVEEQMSAASDDESESDGDG